MRNNMSIRDIFYKLPSKRQQRLQNRMDNMDMEIEIELEEITIVKETEHSIMAMVPCMSGDIAKSLYIEYFFDSASIEFSHMLHGVSFWQKIKACTAYLFGRVDSLGKVNTIMQVDDVDQIVDFLTAVSEDIKSSDS